jgi:hypothetical protein
MTDVGQVAENADDHQEGCSMKDRPYWIHDIETFDELKAPDLHECLDLGSNIHSSGASGPSIRSNFAGNHFWVLRERYRHCVTCVSLRQQHKMSHQVIAGVSMRFGRGVMREAMHEDREGRMYVYAGWSCSSVRLGDSIPIRYAIIACHRPQVF